MSTTAVQLLVVADSSRNCSKKAAADEGFDSADSCDFVISTVPSVTGDAKGFFQQAFKQSQLASGLSQLGRSASGNHTVYQKLEVTHTDLDDAQHVAHYKHIQQLVLSHNRLSTLQPLSQLVHLTSLDVSHNSLTQALDFTVQPPNLVSDTASTSLCACSIGSQPHNGYCSTQPCPSSNLRQASMRSNSISDISMLAFHSNLRELDLAGNQLQKLGKGLNALKKLKRLDLSYNHLSSCMGFGDSLQELFLDGNHISSLQLLHHLTALHTLTAARNEITGLDGVEGLSSLRKLDVSSNQLRRVEALAACSGLTLLTHLSIAGNPLQAAQDARLHVVHLLGQVRQLDGLEVSVHEKVAAANMVGAATDDLVLIRKRFFPHGELDDGGGAVPPTAAGLKASCGEEERSCADLDAMFDAIDRWAKAVQPSLALQQVTATPGTVAACSGPRSASACSPTHPSVPSASLVPQQAHTSRRASSASSSGSTRHSSRRSSSAAGLRASQHAAGGQPAQCGGVTAVAARLALGCCQEAPFRQLQLLRACFCWVQTYVALPRDCSAEVGPDLVTWDVGRQLFSDQHHGLLLQEVLLPGYQGTWAECVARLLVLLLRACQLEAVQLSGFWKAGGKAGVQPGNQLSSHNHCWVAAKVNGRWRLLDPVASLIMSGRDQPLPFFLAPEAFIHTHLPFEPCWQLLPQPVRAADWWQQPALALSFAAAGGRLLEGAGLQACVVLEADRDAQVLPSLRIPIAAPLHPHQQLRVSLLDSRQQLVASWRGSSRATHPPAQLQHPASTGSSPQQSLNDRQQCQQQQPWWESDACSHPPLVYQQPVLGASGLLQVQVGPKDVQLAAQELWVTFPSPGVFHVQIEQLTEVPGGLIPHLQVDGLSAPLALDLHQQLEVLTIKVEVKLKSYSSQEAGSGCQLPPGQAPTIHVNTQPDIDSGKHCDVTDTQHASPAAQSCSPQELQPYWPPIIAHLPQLLLTGPAELGGSCQAAGLRPAAAATAAGAAADYYAQPQVQLVHPQPGVLLEADRLQHFQVLACGAAAVAVGSEQYGWTVLQEASAAEGLQASTAAGAAARVSMCDVRVFQGSVLLPRVATCCIAVQLQQQPQEPPCCSTAGPAIHSSSSSSSTEWLPVLGLHVWPPVQDLVPVQDAPAAAAPDAASFAQGVAVGLMRGLDVGGDGVVSRKDMLVAFRRDRQLADHLKMPAKIRAGDGTFDIFLTKFTAINTSGLGYINLQELAAHLAASNRASTARAGTSRVPTAASQPSRQT